MKYLTLIRHASAENAGSGVGDEDRNLTDQGVQDARRLGTFLLQAFPLPQTVYTSVALRARRTVEELLREVPRDVPLPDTEVETDLYLADADEIWDFAYSGFLESDELWICAHDPGITEAVERLSGSRIERVTAGGVIRIAFEDLLPHGRNGSLCFFDIPENHRR